MNKKQMILTAMLLFAATNLSYAQFFFPGLEKLSPAQKDRIERIYTSSLSSENKGLVESVLAIVTMIKLDLPADEMPMLREKIENLATHSTTPAILYEARLASAVFADPSNFEQARMRQYSDATEFFDAIDGKFDQTSLSSK